EQRNTAEPGTIAARVLLHLRGECAREVLSMNVLLTIVAVALALLSPVCTQQASAPPALSPEGRAAYDRLAAADVFAIGPVGVAGTTPADEMALRVLLGDFQADAALTSLVESATPAGKLYGLAGLSVIDRDRAGALGHELAAVEGSTEVEDVLGCTVMRVKVSEVLQRIERGGGAGQLKRPARAPAA